MLSNLEIGGNTIVSWLVIIVYMDWKTFYTWSRVKEEGGDGALAGGFRSICEAKDGSERWESFCEFVLLFVVVEDAFRPPASFCLRNGSG